MPTWAGAGVLAGYTVVRALAGFGSGSGLVSGLASLPDAPNSPGLTAGVAGSAGSVGASASAGPGGALVCPPRRRAGARQDYEPDLEDELLWHSLRRSVPTLVGWQDGSPREAPGESSAASNRPDDRAEEERSRSADPPPSAVTLIRTRPCASMAVLGLVVALIALAAELLYLRRLANPTGVDIVRNAAYGAWTVGWMMLATVGIRTFRLRDVTRFWLVGFFATTGIVAVVGAGITTAMTPGLLRMAIVIPVTEEVVKALLLLAFLLVAVRGRGREPSVTDMMIVGFAVGAAFGVHEDALWVRVAADGFGAGWGSLFPVFAWDPFVLVAHAGWTALAGLGLGLAWHFRRRAWAWVLAIVPLGVAIYDHVSINYVVFQATEQGVTRGAGWTMRELTGHGSLVAQLVVVGFLAAVVVDWLTLRRRLSADPLPTWATLPGIRANLGALPGPGTRLLGAILLSSERRAHLGARYARDRTQPQPGENTVPA